MDYLDYLRKKGKLIRIDLSDDEIARRMFRASGEVVCEECGQEYYKHPFVENWLDSEDRPFLHLICNGDIVKL